MDDFACFLEGVVTSCGKVLNAGDFNIHVESKENSASQRVLALLDHFDLQQHVRGPTHIEGHTLDLIISRSSDRLVACCTASSLINDQLSVDAWIRAHRKIRARETVFFRSISRIDTDLFNADILKLPLILNPASTADGLLEQFNTRWSSLLNKHAPLRQKALPV